MKSLLGDVKVGKLFASPAIVFSAFCCLSIKPAQAFVFGFGGSSTDAPSQDVSFSLDIDSSLKSLGNGYYPNVVKDFEIGIDFSSRPDSSFGQVSILSEGSKAELTVEDCKSIETCIPDVNLELISVFGGPSEEDFMSGLSVLLDRKYLINFEGAFSDDFKDVVEEFNDMNTHGSAPISLGESLEGELKVVFSESMNSSQLLSFGLLTYASPSGLDAALEELRDDIVEPEIVFDLTEISGADVPEPVTSTALLVVGITYGLKRLIKQ